MEEPKCQKKLDTMTTIEDLPNEVLEKIFHHFSMYEVQHNLALVSKQFLKVSRIPGMVDNIKIIIGPGKITNVYQRKMLKHRFLTPKMKNHGALASKKQHKLDFEEKKNICFDKAKSIVEAHPDAKIELLYFDHLGHETCYLFYAISNGNIEEVKFLLKHMGDNAKNIKDSRGNSPLHRSAEIGNIALTKILLQFEPKWVNSLNNMKWTPLHSAACDPVVCCIFTSDQNKLHCLCCVFTSDPKDLHCHEVTKILLEHGADANVLDEHNKTPLHWTILGYHGSHENKCLNMTKVKILLEHGAWASLGLKNRFGETLLEEFKNRRNPIDMAISSEDKQNMIDLLKNYQEKLTI